MLYYQRIRKKTRDFLEYLKDIIAAKDIKAVDISKQNLQANFPMLTLEDIDSFKSSLVQSNVSEAIYKIAKEINKFSPKELLNSIIRSCIRMQANHYYKKCKEDIRNDYIRDLLSTEGYDVLDHSRHGSSKNW